MPLPRVYHVFISHAWKYDADYGRLVGLLREAQGAGRLDWKNYSVPQHDPLDAKSDRVLEAKLREQIRHASVVVIISGMYAAYRQWIQKEIDIAQDLGKPIIGVRPWGQERVPVQVQSAAKEMVGWNTDSIVASIKRWSL